MLQLVGFGKKNRLIKNHASTLGTLVVLLGGPTGRDGIGGSQFASDSLESEDTVLQFKSLIRLLKN